MTGDFVFHEVEVSKEELIQALRNECVAFFAFYMEDRLELDVPELHESIWEEMLEMVRKVNLNEWTDHLQKVFCVPRGFAKSTVIKLAVVLFMRFSRLYFTLYLSRTTPIAKAACRDIFNWFYSENDQELFGKAEKPEKNNESEGLWIFTIQTPDFGPKRVILMARGSDQQVRGTLVDSHRPQLMIFDDVEDNDTANTPESQKKLDEWFMGNALKASARRSIRIVLGNMINSRTMLYRLAADKKWSPTIYGAIVRNKETGELESLWEAWAPLEKLLADYKDYRSKGVGHVWVYEMMNMTADTVFKTELDSAIRIPRPVPEQVTAGIITVDPAFGEKAWNDESALVAHVKIEDWVIPHMVESRKGRFDEGKMLDNIIEMLEYWNLTTVGIESVAAQKLLIPLFQHMLTDRGYPKDLITFLPLPSGGKAKASRILAMAKSVGSGSYGIVEEEEDMFLEIQNYDPSSKDHDDRPDSAAYGPIAWSQAGNQIEENGRFKEKFALLTNSDSDEQEDVHELDIVPY